MNNIQTISRNQIVESNKSFLGLLLQRGDFGESVTVEKNISMDWAYKLYKGSVFDAFWSILSSPVE